MTKFVAVSREHHGAKNWRRVNSYSFAATDAVVPVVGAELAKAALAMPLAFFKEKGRYRLVAVLSFTPGRNMFVGPDGRWLGNYAPATLRAYPFCLLPQQGTDDVVLCVDEDSGLVVDGTAGEEFWDTEGKPSPALNTVIQFLEQVDRGRRVTDLITAALAEADLIVPWEVTTTVADGERHRIEGLYRVDEDALNKLPEDKFLGLRQVSALPLAYAQILSVGNLLILEQFAKLHQQALGVPTRPNAIPASLDDLFRMSTDDTLKFDFGKPPGGS